MGKLKGVSGFSEGNNETDTRMEALDYRVDSSKLNSLDDVVEFIGLAGFFMNSEDPNYKATKKYLQDVSIQERMQEGGE